MKADTICCYCISKLMTKRIAESLHAYITRARLTACEVGVFSRDMPTPLFEEPLKFIAHGRIFVKFRYYSSVQNPQKQSPYKDMLRIYVIYLNAITIPILKGPGCGTLVTR